METPQHQNTGNHLRSHCAHSHPGYAKRNHNDQQKIQRHIGHPGHSQKYQRSLCISYGSKDCSTIIIKHKKGHPKKINPHIECCLTDHIPRRIHNPQSASCSSKSYKCHQNPTDQSKRNGRMYRFRHLFVPSCRIISGSQDVCPQRNANKKIGKNINQRRRRSHCRQCLAAAEPPHHNDIHSIKHQLQDTGKH